MTASQPNNPLHGVTLERMLREMVERYGREGLARASRGNGRPGDPGAAVPGQGRHTRLLQVKPIPSCLNDRGSGGNHERMWWTD